jgi:NADH:ubiquinone oxidoreductase subunit 6 (subunit J)
MHFLFCLKRTETRILDYPLQQEKLVPCLATTYAFFVTFMKLDTYFGQLKTNENVFLEQLPEVSDVTSFLFEDYQIFVEFSFMLFHPVSRHTHHR